jgi:hypothetical protein
MPARQMRAFDLGIVHREGDLRLERGRDEA